MNTNDLTPGQKVRIKRGTFANLEGVLTEADAYEFIVDVQIGDKTARVPFSEADALEMVNESAGT